MKNYRVHDFAYNRWKYFSAPANEREKKRKALRRSRCPACVEKLHKILYFRLQKHSLQGIFTAVVFSIFMRGDLWIFYI